MANSVIYPILSLIAFFWLFFVLNKPIYIPRNYSILFFFVLSSVWALLADFNGADMNNYLSYFSKLDFNELGFYGSKIEFTVALFPALLKEIFFITDEHNLMIAHRLFTFTVIPSAILLFARNRANFQSILSCLVVYLFLLPYTFLSLVNIILNGFSLALLSYSLLLVLPFPNFQSLVKTERYLFARNILLAILLFLSFFAHGYGTVSIALLIAGGVFIEVLVKLRIVTFKRKFYSLVSISLIILPICFAFAFGIAKLLTSKLPDNTIILSSIICLAFAYLSRSMFNLLAPPSLDDISHIGFRSKVNYFWYLLFCLSIISVGLGAFGGGDAAERFISGSINLNVLFYVYYGVLYRNNQKYRFANFNAFGGVGNSVPILNSCFLFLLLVMNTYFYISQAFLSNI